MVMLLVVGVGVGVGAFDAGVDVAAGEHGWTALFDHV